MDVPETFNLASCLVDRHVAEGRGHRVAIHTATRDLTYRDVLELTNRTGNALLGLGVRPEERVLLLLHDVPELVCSFFGAMKIGAVAVPVSTLLVAADYEHMLRDSRAAVAVVGEALWPRLAGIARERLPRLRHVVVVGDAPEGALSFDALTRAASPDLQAEPTSRDDAAFWLYSSGTTGAPKGVIHAHQDAVHTAEHYARGVLGIHEGDRCFSVAKLFFAYGLGNGLTFPFYVGASTVLHAGPPAARSVYDVVARHRPTLFFSVPTGYGMLLAETGEADLSSVRLAVSAGEALPGALYERFRARFGLEILDGIGSTEVLHIFISNRPGRVRPGSSGEVVPGYEARIEADDGELVRPGEVGHLLIRGESTCAAYWNQRQKTRATLRGDWIRTGDQYRQDEDGYFWHAGRSDDMLKVGGIWVSPVEIEATLAAHPAVHEAGVVGRDDGDGLVKPAAWVVLRAGHAASEALAADVQAFVRERLAAYKRPRWVEFVASLPRTATGKLQRFKLRESRAPTAGTGTSS